MTASTDLQSLGKHAQQAAYQLATLSTSEKNHALTLIADELQNNIEHILVANDKDIVAGKKQGLSEAMLDRLLLTESRIQSIISDIHNVITLDDPVGSEIDHRILENGMTLSRRREPIGVIGVIYEARPNVTIDIATLCLKTGNACILRGGKETFHSNLALIHLIHAALKKANIAIHAVQYIEKTDREYVMELLKLDAYVDMIIPRGGAGLHEFCKANSRIPVIIGGFGVCHLYVDETADLQKALPVIINAKVDRPSACNSLDTLLVNRKIANDLLGQLIPLLNDNEIRVLADAHSLPHLTGVNNLAAAEETDYGTEWLSKTLCIKEVKDVQEALKHMRENNAIHSDGVFTNDLTVAETFINGAGSAAVYVNASTRFTDGAQFGLGAEVAVSTQKLHARGPMGLEELTTYKWVGKGDYLLRK